MKHLHRLLLQIRSWSWNVNRCQCKLLLSQSVKLWMIRITFPCSFHKISNSSSPDSALGPDSDDSESRALRLASKDLQLVSSLYAMPVMTVTRNFERS
jgi:hypothetical protein